MSGFFYNKIHKGQTLNLAPTGASYRVARMAGAVLHKAPMLCSLKTKNSSKGGVCILVLIVNFECFFENFN